MPVHCVPDGTRCRLRAVQSERRNGASPYPLPKLLDAQTQIPGYLGPSLVRRDHRHRQLLPERQTGTIAMAETERLGERKHAPRAHRKFEIERMNGKTKGTDQLFRLSQRHSGLAELGNRLLNRQRGDGRPVIDPSLDLGGTLLGEGVSENG